MSTRPTAGGKKPKKTHHLPSEDYLEIAERVRSGAYFREARSMYDLGVHDPMAERYMYVFITFIALTILLVTLKAMQDFYPLNTSIPIIISSDDNGDELPHLIPLVHTKEDDPSEMLLRFLVKNYVMAWEEYNITTFDRDAGTVKSQSTDELAKEYVSFIDPVNPDSPIAQYQRHSKRKVTILSMREFSDHMDVMFEAEVDSRTDTKKSRWYANIAFQYSGLRIDQKTDNPAPIRFLVTSYHSKRLQDGK